MTDSKREGPSLTLQEYAVWKYALEVCRPDGTFHQTAVKIKDSMHTNASPSTILRAVEGLAKKGWFYETAAPTRDSRGWQIPAKYRVVKKFEGVYRHFGGGLHTGMKVK